METNYGEWIRIVHARPYVISMYFDCDYLQLNNYKNATKKWLYHVGMTKYVALRTWKEE